MKMLISNVDANVDVVMHANTFIASANVDANSKGCGDANAEVNADDGHE